MSGHRSHKDLEREVANERIIESVRALVKLLFLRVRATSYQCIASVHEQGMTPLL